MLKHDTTTRFVQSGVFSKKYRFIVRGAIGKQFTKAEYQALLEQQLTIPVPLWKPSDSRRCWWMYRNEVYWEDEGLTAPEVEALILDREKKRRRRIDKALAATQLDRSQDAGFLRRPIPDDVKMFVWQRDKGKCVKCGSNANLEFDHIIPVAMGGGNTARNIQLLCEDCNKSKGASIT